MSPCHLWKRAGNWRSGRGSRQGRAAGRSALGRLGALPRAANSQAAPVSDGASSGGQRAMGRQALQLPAFLPITGRPGAEIAAGRGQQAEERGPGGRRLAREHWHAPQRGVSRLLRRTGAAIASLRRPTRRGVEGRLLIVA
jgi:hypothetical protein